MSGAPGSGSGYGSTRRYGQYGSTPSSSSPYGGGSSGLPPLPPLGSSSGLSSSSRPFGASGLDLPPLSGAEASLRNLQSRGVRAPMSPSGGTRGRSPGSGGLPPLGSYYGSSSGSSAYDLPPLSSTSSRPPRLSASTISEYGEIPPWSSSKGLSYGSSPFDGGRRASVNKGPSRKVISPTSL